MQRTGHAEIQQTTHRFQSWISKIGRRLYLFTFVYYLVVLNDTFAEPGPTPSWELPKLVPKTSLPQVSNLRSAPPNIERTEMAPERNVSSFIYVVFMYVVSTSINAPKLGIL